MSKRMLINIIIGMVVIIVMLLGLRWSHPYAWEHDKNVLSGQVYQQMTEAEIDTAFKKAESNGKLTLVIFHKDGCKKCRSVERHVHQKVENTTMNVITIDTRKSDQRKYIPKFNIQSVPTFIVMQNGQELVRYAGTNEAAIDAIFDTTDGINNEN